MTARLARHIRRRCQRNSQCLEHCGISELFLAPRSDADAILAARDLRLRYWLLGFGKLPGRLYQPRINGQTTFGSRIKE
jgi:hypothetical protein